MPIIIDTETTGLKAPEPVEIGYIKICSDFTRFPETTPSNHQTYNERFRPSKPISLEASKIHGIFMKDLIHCRPSYKFEMPKHEYFIAHNANFDHRVLKKPDSKLICTLKLSRILYPKNGQLLNHKLPTVVTYLFGSEFNEELKTSHSALGDCVLTFFLLQRIIKDIGTLKSWEDLHKLSK